ncbi:DeoR/GlpR family DNA-binding transcription regulator [Lacisediminihabitans changchengi]|uniref:DeoR/GlpR transcriptional regulator n=1 Tax=Lacisediminihabitans changchengi TaxID=2787634 RepID=A0A934VYQ3_9MICO|nr:DeoR/GlpR family DNA-binding transcription regulator [Lacisediminihabitans changchengi]MBK4348287.1 DeoR/GlpR transcriptional regulator [Lacisediminihabitans changchengi]
MSDTSAPPPAAIRRARMLEHIDAQGFARVSELSALFGVSEVTVRADLESLEVQRVHGGAVASQRIENTFEQSLNDASDEKRRIGVAAAALVESGQAIVLDVGTTTTAVATALLERPDLRDVVVITNALNIAMALEPAIPRFTVVVTGGTLRPLQHSLVDPLAGAVLDHIRADLAFIGCSGVDATAGVTNINLPEADVKRRMLATAARSIVVADSSKLGVAQLSRVAPLADIDALITVAEADTGALRAAGLQVIPA